MKRVLSALLCLSLLLIPALGAEAPSPEVGAPADAQEYTVERRLYGLENSVVLRWRSLRPDRPELRDYELYLLSPSYQPLKRLLLPSTVCLPDGYAPTHRAPDSMSLSRDASSCVYTYRFPEALYNQDGVLLHEAGTYTYTADLTTGELLSVSHRLGTGETGFWDVLPEDWFAPYVNVCVEEGLMNGVGDSFFAPEDTLSGYECSVLALRLYDLGRGGDGTFEKAPWDWGYAYLTLSDGTALAKGYLRDDSVWDWTRLHRGDSGHVGFRLETEEEKEWGRSLDYQSAVLKVNGVEYPGTLHLSGPGFLYFSCADIDGYNAVIDAWSIPTPNGWWRDAWYYAERNGLRDILMEGNNERWSFAYLMARVTDLPAINTIAGLPDTGDPDVLKLYRAGVLTGNDEYGTFDYLSTMTRAEGAAICARILRPELRVSFTPKPLESYENYTLTYLRDDVVRPGGPYRPMLSKELLTVDCRSLLRLDGTEFSLPEGYEIASIGGGGAGLINYETMTYGVMDSQGQFREATRDEAFSFRDPWSETPDSRYQNGEYLQAFFNEKGEQVTPSFDWIGLLNGQNAGFVGLDRKVYRIQLGV